MSSSSTDLLLQEDGSQDPKDYRKRLFNHLDALEEEKRTLSTRINDTAPISQVPPEIVTDIISALASSVGDSSWITATHLFRGWRAIALKCPSLWSTPSFEHPDLAMTMLRRSGNAPLTIQFDGKSQKGPYEDALREALSYTDRLRRIAIEKRRNNDVNFQDIFDGVVSRSFPLLESLTLHSTEECAGGKWPEQLCNIEAPSLRILNLYRIRLPAWKTLPISSTLTHLTLRFVWFPSFDHPKEEELVASLEAMTKLRTLHLDSVLPKITQPTVKDAEGPHVKLPALKSLKLADEPLSINWFLATVQIRPNANVDVTYLNNFGDAEGLIDTFYQNLVESYPIARNGIRKLRICENVPHDFELYQIFELAFDNDHNHQRNDVNYTLRLCFRNPHESEWEDVNPFRLEPILTTLDQRLDLSPLRRLELYIGFLSTTRWRRSFAHLERLNSISMFHLQEETKMGQLPVPNANPFIHALQPSSDAAAGARTEVPFPGLKQLVFGMNDVHGSPLQQYVAPVMEALDGRTESSSFTLCIKKIPAGFKLQAPWSGRDE